MLHVNGIIHTVRHLMHRKGAARKCKDVNIEQENGNTGPYLYYNSPSYQPYHAQLSRNSIGEVLASDPDITKLLNNIFIEHH